MTIEELLQDEINKTYGPMVGNKTGKVLIPAFLGDFRKVLEGSDPGVTTSEEYMTEDKKMHLIFRGQRRMTEKGVDFILTSVTCNDSELLSTELSMLPKLF